MIHTTPTLAFTLVIASYILIRLLFLILNLIKSTNRDITFIEMIPPLKIDKNLYATERLFSVLHSIDSKQSLLSRIIREKEIVSLEIVASKQAGIRYVVGIDRKSLPQLKQTVLAYSPSIHIKRVGNPMEDINLRQSRILSLRQEKNFTNSLLHQSYDQQHDPLNYLEGVLVKLKDDERVILQLTVSKYGKKFHWRTQKDHAKSANREKLKVPLFSASLRVIVSCNSPVRNVDKIAGLKAFFSSYTVSGSQSLKAHTTYLPPINAYNAFLCSKRLITLTWRRQCIFSSLEIASLYHFPVNSKNTHEDTVRVLSRALPVPLSHKTNKNFDLILGHNTYHDIETPIGLTNAERRKHIYVVGGTGNGKSTILLGSILQDINKGKGLAVIDPHGDLAEQILDKIPKKRIAEVVYFNPDDTSYPIGVNLLEIPDNLEGDELLKYKDLITESTIDVFRKLFLGDGNAHRIEYILRNTIHTALTVKGATIFTVYDLLNDPAFRRVTVYKLKDKNLKNFWLYEYTKAGEFQQVKMVAGVTAKIGRLLFSLSAKRILEQDRSTISFDEIIQTNKILICNLSKGRLGSDTSSIIGTMLLAKIQIAVLRRSQIEEAYRVPYYLYVDEFHNFAIQSFVELLSEARKYKLFVTIAEQTAAQQEDKRMVNIILANIGVLIVFRSGSSDDEKLLLPLFSPYLEAGDIINLSSFNFFVRISSTVAAEPTSGVTIRPSNYPTSYANEIILSSRELYSKKYIPPEEAKPRPGVPFSLSPF